MINGGIASGKSSSLQQQIASAKAEGVEWKDVLHLNRDALKAVLVHPSDLPADMGAEHKKFYTSFAEDEAFLLRDMILQEDRERLETDTAPHFFIDQVYPNEDMLLMAGDPEGKGLDLTIVQTPVENSFRMFYG